MSDILDSIQQCLLPSPEDELEKTRSITANLHHAQKVLKKAKHEADALRRKHLESVLNAARASKQHKKSKAITHLICVEQNRHCYAAFQQHTKPKSCGGLAYLTITDEQVQTTQTLLEPEEISNTLLEYSRTHFAKAQGSPFMVEPLQHLLNYDGLTPLGDHILSG